MTPHSSFPLRITGELDRAEATQERLMQYMTRGQNS